MTKAKAGFARPRKKVEFTREIAEDLCAWIAGGGSVNEWCRKPGQIAKSSIYLHLTTDDWFMEMYERACRARAYAQFEEIVDIADGEPDPQKARVRIHARQWAAGRMDDRFKEKQTVQHEGNLTVEIVRFSEPQAGDDD